MTSPQPPDQHARQEAFDRHAAEGHTRIPVVREVLSDLDTPLSVYLKLADGPHTYLFESVEGGERFGRYSIIGLPARRVYAFAGNTLYVTEHGELLEAREVADPFAEVERLRAAHSVPRLEGLPGFTGGLVGWFGFECVRYIEPRLAQRSKPDELGTPDILLMLSEEVAVFDNLKGRLYLVVHADPREPQAWARANRRLDELSHRLRHAGAGYPETLLPAALDEGHFVSGFTREGFIAAVEKSKEYIAAGDVFQVVLSQRMSVPFHARPVDVYRALRALNPSPYMYFLDVGEMQVVGSSPEILVRLQHDTDGHGVVTVRPIAGTRPRGRTPEEDAALEAELLADPKERAEHLMLVDLGRNDVGRVAEFGSVRLTAFMAIERYSHVMHLVSEVRGRLRPELDAVAALAASFPAGTVSGAPKVRAMQIIDELEPVRRGPYAGAVGYIGWGARTMDTAITIRTCVMRGGRAWIQAGAGIVADSDPAAEWRETEAKARAVLLAVALAGREGRKAGRTEGG